MTDIERLQKTMDAAHLADASLHRIEVVLRGLRDAFSSARIGAADVPDDETLQARVDLAIDEIERIVRSCEAEGRALLSGGGVLPAFVADGCAEGAFTLARCGADHLGERGVGVIAELRSTGRPGQARIDAGAALRIVDGASSQIAGERGRLAALCRDRIAPGIDVLAASVENVSAARTTCTDLEFAVQTGRLTMLDVLVHTRLGSPRACGKRTTPVLGISRE